jgi:hypothetical protein
MRFEAGCRAGEKSGRLPEDDPRVMAQLLVFAMTCIPSVEFVT